MARALKVGMHTSRSHLVATAVAVLAMTGADPSAADSITRTLAGSGDGRPVSARITLDFQPTGGSFELGSGTATLQVTVENTSDLIGFQAPSTGNWVFTGLSFNLPANAAVQYAGAVLLPDGFVFQRAGNVGERVAGERDLSTYFALDRHAPTGTYGMFTYALETTHLAEGGLVAEALFDDDAVPQGDFHPAVVVAGTMRYTFLLSNLGADTQSASGLLGTCSTARGNRRPASLGASFESSGPRGRERAVIGDPCAATHVIAPGWGRVKQMYR
jgi:hypothetical protein